MSPITRPTSRTWPLEGLTETKKLDGNEILGDIALYSLVMRRICIMPVSNYLIEDQFLISHTTRPLGGEIEFIEKFFETSFIWKTLTWENGAIGECGSQSNLSMRKLHAFFIKTSKKSLKRNSQVRGSTSQVGGYIFQILHSMTNRMVPTPHRYLSCVWRNKQNNFEKFSENRKISCYFWKNVKKRY